MVLRLLDLPWCDVIYSHIFNRLDLRDLCHLRCLSTEYQLLVDNYIATWDTLDTSSFTDFEPSSFEGLIRACVDLRRVNLKNNNWLRSSHLVVLLDEHPGLTHLDLTGCNGPQMRCDNNNNKNFIETIKCRNLTSVRLRSCSWLTPDVLSSLVRYNRNIRQLVLADCYRVSDEAVESILEYLTALTDLSLEKTTVTDRSLVAISKCSNVATSIERLDLRFCHFITNNGLMLLRCLRCLKELRVAGCALVSERGLASLRARVDIDLSPTLICAPRAPRLQV